MVNLPSKKYYKPGRSTCERGFKAWNQLGKENVEFFIVESEKTRDGAIYIFSNLEIL